MQANDGKNNIDQYLNMHNGRIDPEIITGILCIHYLPLCFGILYIEGKKQQDKCSDKRDEMGQAFPVPYEIDCGQRANIQVKQRSPEEHKCLPDKEQMREVFIHRIVKKESEIVDVNEALGYQKDNQ